MTPASQLTAEQRSPMYEDLRLLLMPGFLTEIARINDTLLSLRTFNRADYFMLSSRTAGGEGPEGTDWILASAIWMVDGQPLLEDPSATYHVYQRCQLFPKVVRDDLLVVLGRLRERVSTALDRLESYLYEDESRFLWKSYGPRLSSTTGVPGAERLGMNALQESWVAYNEIEDQREVFLQQWTQAKLIASALAPKGIKKLNSSDDAAQRRLQQQRQDTQSATYYRFIGRDDLVPKGSQGPESQYSERYVARSVEDLQEEYKNWRLGIKDEHDLIVDAYKARIRDKIERERKDREERLEQIERALEAEGVREPPIRNLMGDVETLSPGRARGTTKVYSNKSDHVYDKYIKQDPVPGSIQMRGDVPVSVPDSPLQDRVAARKPKG